MIQFYFLSIICNASAGYILISDKEQNDAFQLVLGVMSVMSGMCKLVSVIQGDVPVVGDIIPAAAGLAAGFVLLFGYYRKVSTLEPSETPSLLELFLDRYKKHIGFWAFGAAVLHFLFPQALFI